MTDTLENSKIVLIIILVFLIACIIAISISIKKSKEAEGTEIFSLCMFSVLTIACIILLASPANVFADVVHPEIGIKLFPYIEFYYKGN